MEVRLVILLIRVNELCCVKVRILKMRYLFIYLFFYIRLKFYSSLVLVYICVKLPPKDLNSGSYPPHPTSTNTCRVTIAPTVCDGENKASVN